MTGAHLSGATIGAVIAFIASRYGWNVSQDEALTLGVAFAGIGAGLAHLFQPPGLIPRVKAALGLSSTAVSK